MHSVSPLFLLPAAPLCGHRCFAEWKADTTPHIYKSDSLNQYWTLRVLLRGLFTINISFPPYLGGWNWHFLRLSLSLASQFKPIRGAKCLGSVKGPFRCIYVALAGVFYSEQIVLTRCRYCEMHDWIMSADADEAKGGSDGKTWDLSWNIRRNRLCFVLWHTDVFIVDFISCFRCTMTDMEMDLHRNMTWSFMVEISNTSWEEREKRHKSKKDQRHLDVMISFRCLKTFSK